MVCKQLSSSSYTCSEHCHFLGNEHVSCLPRVACCRRHRRTLQTFDVHQRLNRVVVSVKHKCIVFVECIYHLRFCAVVYRAHHCERKALLRDCCRAQDIEELYNVGDFILLSEGVPCVGLCICPQRPQIAATYTRDPFSCRDVPDCRLVAAPPADLPPPHVLIGYALVSSTSDGEVMSRGVVAGDDVESLRSHRARYLQPTESEVPSPDLIELQPEGRVALEPNDTFFVFFPALLCLLIVFFRHLRYAQLYVATPHRIHNVQAGCNGLSRHEILPPARLRIFSTITHEQGICDREEVVVRCSRCVVSHTMKSRRKAPGMHRDEELRCF